MDKKLEVVKSSLAKKDKTERLLRIASIIVVVSLGLLHLKKLGEQKLMELGNATFLYGGPTSIENLEDRKK